MSWLSEHSIALFLGKLEQANALLHYLQRPFCITLYLQGTLNKDELPVSSPRTRI
jgi:hypothetical protein